jgi:hypothetical protein
MDGSKHPIARDRLESTHGRAEKGRRRGQRFEMIRSDWANPQTLSSDKQNMAEWNRDTRANGASKGSDSLVSGKSEQSESAQARKKI